MTMSKATSYFLGLAVMLVAGSAAAAPRCQADAEKWATALEGVFTELEGGAQGDNDELQLTTKLTSSKSTADGVVETYRIDSDHTNEDGETWTARYEVKLLAATGLGCYVRSYRFLGMK